MSMYLRPMVEKWGESVTYSSRNHIADVLVALARRAVMRPAWAASRRKQNARARRSRQSC
jgi:hypothetical protein